MSVLWIGRSPVIKAILAWGSQLSNVFNCLTLLFYNSRYTFWFVSGYCSGHELGLERCCQSCHPPTPDKVTVFCRKPAELDAFQIMEECWKYDYHPFTFLATPQGFLQCLASVCPSIRISPAFKQNVCATSMMHIMAQLDKSVLRWATRPSLEIRIQSIAIFLANETLQNANNSPIINRCGIF